MVDKIVFEINDYRPAWTTNYYLLTTNFLQTSNLKTSTND